MDNSELPHNPGAPLGGKTNHTRTARPPHRESNPTITSQLNSGVRPLHSPESRIAPPASSPRRNVPFADPQESLPSHTTTSAFRQLERGQNSKSLPAPSQPTPTMACTLSFPSQPPTLLFSEPDFPPYPSLTSHAPQAVRHLNTDHRQYNSVGPRDPVVSRSNSSMPRLSASRPATPSLGAYPSSTSSTSGATPRSYTPDPQTPETDPPMSRGSRVPSTSSTLVDTSSSSEGLYAFQTERRSSARVISPPNAEAEETDGSSTFLPEHNGTLHDPDDQFDPIDCRSPPSSFQNDMPTPSTLVTYQDYDDAEQSWLNEISSHSGSSTEYDVSHKTLAVAEAKFPWDGKIRGRQTPGLALTVGEHIDICDVIDSNWYRAHSLKGCFAVPCAYVDVKSCIDDRHRRLFEQSLTAPKHYNLVHPPPKHKTGFTLLRRLLGHNTSHDQYIESILDPRPIHPPPLPPAPFEREPHDFTNIHGRILASTECRRARKQEGLIIAVSLDVVAFPHARFTGLALDVEIPGQKIVNIYPEERSGPQTEVQHNNSLTEEITSEFFGVPMGETAGTRFRSSRTQQTTYTQQQSSYTIKGLGRRTSKATWRASEDTTTQSGLEQPMKFFILLPTPFPPSKLLCKLSGSSTKSPNRLSGSPVESFSTQWEVGFT